MGIRDSIFGILKRKKKETEEYIDDLQETKRKRTAERDVEKAQKYLGPEFREISGEIRKKHLEALKLMKERADAEVERQKRITAQEKERLKIPSIRSPDTRDRGDLIPSIRPPGIRGREDIKNIARQFSEADREIQRRQQTQAAEQAKEAGKVKSILLKAVGKEKEIDKKREEVQKEVNQDVATYNWIRKSAQGNTREAQNFRIILSLIDKYLLAGYDLSVALETVSKMGWLDNIEKVSDTDRKGLEKKIAGTFPTDLRKGPALPQMKTFVKEKKEDVAWKKESEGYEADVRTYEWIKGEAQKNTPDSQNYKIMLGVIEKYLAAGYDIPTAVRKVSGLKSIDNVKDVGELNKKSFLFTKTPGLIPNVMKTKAVKGSKEGIESSKKGLKFLSGEGKSVFSKHVCPYCHSPTIEVKVGKNTRHMCSRNDCPYSHPKKCPICGEESLDIDTDTHKTFCTNENCGTNTGDEEKARENIKKLENHVSDYGIKGERLEEHHKKAVWRTALIMMLGVIPMIFPGGFAGIMFLLGIWSLALEFYFPAKVKHEGSMIFKGLSRVGTICFFTAGFFFFGQPLLSLGMLLVGYYSLPSGIADHDKYRKFLGLFRMCFSIGLMALSFFALGGPPLFRFSLAAFVFAYLFSMPIKRGESLEASFFIGASLAGMFMGMMALGISILSPMFLGFFIVVIGMIMYAISKFKEIEEKNKEEIKEKEDEEEEELKEKELEIAEEIEDDETEEKSEKLKKTDKDMGVV